MWSWPQPPDQIDQGRPQWNQGQPPDGRARRGTRNNCMPPPGRSIGLETARPFPSKKQPTKALSTTAIKDVADMFDAAMLSMDTKTIDKDRNMDLGASKHLTWDVTNMRNIHGIETSKARSAGGQSQSVEGNVSFQFNGQIIR